MRSPLRCLAPSLLMALAACGGAAVQAPTTATVAHPSTPSPSFVHAPHAFLLRIDCAAIRATPLAAAVSELWRASPLFGRLVASDGLDPIRDFDASVASTETLAWHGGPAASRWRIVLRHHAEASEARALIGRLASERGESVVWREGQGMPSALLPGVISRGTPHALALTALHEAVIAPDDEMARLAAVARTQATYRDAEGDVVEPALAAPEGELVYAETSVPPPVLADLGATAARGRVTRAGQGALVRLELDFPDGAGAARVAETATAQLAVLAQNALVAALGLAHPLAVARVEAHGPTLTVQTEATFDELRAALQALAMMTG